MRFVVLLMLTVCMSGTDLERPPERRLFLAPSFSADSLSVYPEWMAFQDTIESDTLFVYRNKAGLIHSFSRMINTGVCIDGECRRLSMRLFWTVTGRYYGFSLPEGEYLSKTEHVPFKDDDYLRLQEILANPYSVLGEYRMDELISEQGEGVDGITAATLAAVKQETVPDAVYTSYTLWHLVYGETQKEIQKYTRGHLTDELAIQLLGSADFEDKFWTLQNMGPRLQWSVQLKKTVLEIIVHEKGLLSTEALSALPDSLLEDPEIQLAFARQFPEMAYLNQRKILERLAKVDALDSQATLEFSAHLLQMSPNVLDGVLALYRAKQVQNEMIDQRIVRLLGHENLFIARKAADYLETKNVNDKQVLRQIKKIRQNRN